MTDSNFGSIWRSLTEGKGSVSKDYIIKDGHLVFGTHLCVPQGSLREFIISELHAGGLSRHFGNDKTYAIVVDRFFWPRLR